MSTDGWLDPRDLPGYVPPTNDVGGRIGGDGDAGVGPRQRAFELDAFTSLERLRSRAHDTAGEDPDRDWRLTQVVFGPCGSGGSASGARSLRFGRWVGGWRLASY